MSRKATATRLKSIASPGVLIQILIFGSPMLAAAILSLIASNEIRHPVLPFFEGVVWCFLLFAVITGLITYFRQTLHYKELISQLQERGDALHLEMGRRKAIEKDLMTREHQMRFIMDGVQAIIAYVGPDRKYQLVNGAYERWFGKPAQSFIGREMGNTIAHEHRDLFNAKIDDVLSGKEVYMEIQVHDAAGVPRTLGGSLVPDRDANGSVVGFFAFGFDLTDRKSVEEEHKVLADAAQIFTSSMDYDLILRNLVQMLVQSMAKISMVHLRNENGDLRCVAKAGEGIDLAHEEELMHVALAVIENARPILSQKPGNDGSSTMIVPLEARGIVLGTLSLTTTDRRYTEADLNTASELGRRAAFAVDNARLYENAKISNRLKDEFLATISHELRTPLNVICGWTDMIVRGEVEAEEVPDVVKIVQRNAQAQTQIVNDLLDMSSIITGKLNFAAKAVKEQAIVESAIHSIELAAAAKNIKLKVKLDTEGATILGDPDRLLQVMWNLLSNAIKFTPAFGTISINTQRRGSYVEWIVSDSGQGIDTDFLPYIFERFRQEDSKITRKFGGLGLGLAISRQIVELHGGTIHASSRGRGLGSSFTVCLPIAKEFVKVAEQVIEKPILTAVPAAPTPLPLEKPLQGLKILAVDDDPGSRQLLNKILKRGGAEVQSAESAHMALEIFESFHPDIVVSDIGMPDGDGYELMRSIHELAPEVPGIALTAFSREEEVDDAIRAGFQSHIAKPYDPSALTKELVRIAAEHATAH